MTFPLRDSDRTAVENLRRKFKCANTNELVLLGDDSSGRARKFAVNLNRCVTVSKNSACKPSSDLVDWLKNKILVLLVNEARIVDGETHK